MTLDPEGLAQPRIPAVPYRVKEIAARQALVKANHPSIPWSLNPYQGCAHACKFCYVPTLQHSRARVKLCDTAYKLLKGKEACAWGNPTTVQIKQRRLTHRAAQGAGR